MQGGPGCASLFGMLYELGPDSVQEDLSLKRNPGAWNFEAGLLFMDQPIGTGFSPAGEPIGLLWTAFRVQMPIGSGLCQCLGRSGLCEAALWCRPVTHFQERRLCRLLAAMGTVRHPYR